MTFALNGLAVGLGVLYPEFEGDQPEQNRQRLWRHAVLRFEFALHPRVDRCCSVFGTSGLHGRASWAVESVIAFVLLSFLIGWLPLKWGLRRLKNFET